MGCLILIMLIGGSLSLVIFMGKLIMLGVSNYIYLIIGILTTTIGIITYFKEYHEKQALIIFYGFSIVCTAILILTNASNKVLNGIVILLGIAAIGCLCGELWNLNPTPPVIGKSCNNCGKSVPISSKVGDRCPHCGVYWAEKNSNE